MAERLRMAEACRAAGFEVQPIPDPHPDLAEAFDAYCCGEHVTHEAMAGGIFGPQRIWCDRCKGEVTQDEDDLDSYSVRTPGLSTQPTREKGETDA